MFTIVQLHDKQKLQLWQSCNYFLSKVATFGERGCNFFNLSKFVCKEAFWEKFQPLETTSNLWPVSLMDRADPG